MATSHTKKQLEDIIAGLNDKLDAMQKSLSDLSGLPKKVTDLESLLKSSKDQCAELVKAIEGMENNLQAMSLKMNNLEQHHRSWSIRVSDMQLNEEQEASSNLVRSHIYNNLLRPILVGAMEMGELNELPSAEQVLEYAHVLPSRDRSKPKPVICRFYSREIRGLVFRHKKAFAPRVPQSNNSQD